MKIRPLSVQEAAASGCTHSVKIDSDDLTETTNNTAQTISLLPVVNGSVVKYGGYFLKTPFQDASDAALNDTAIEIGDGVVNGRYLGSSQVNENGTEITAGFTPNSKATAPHAYVAGDNVDIIFGSMAAKALNDIDTGEIHVFLSLYNFKDLTNI